MLADRSPSVEAKASLLVVSTEWFHWLPLYAVRLFRRPDAADVTTLPTPVPMDAAVAERLAPVDQIRPEERSLRVGWLWIAGRFTDGEGRQRQVRRPLVSIPGRVVRQKPEGAEARVEPRLALHRAGWRIEEANASRWEHRRGELSIELLRDLGLRSPAG